jgi:ATP-dependent Clp protease ATP-binding subunit ClpC
MDKSFHVFARYQDIGVSVAPIVAPHLCAFAPEIAAARTDLIRVLRRLLCRGQLVHDQAHFNDARLRKVELTLLAVQEARLIDVPMRFSVLTYTKEKHDEENADNKKAEKGPLQVFVPRLDLRGELHNPEDFAVFVEELIRHSLYMAPLSRILEVAYAGRETLDTVIVEVPTEKPAERKKNSTKAKTDQSGALAETCRNLAMEVATGALGRAFERESELERLQAMLMAHARSSVLLVGPTQVGKTALVHELVHRTTDKTSPLFGLEIFSTNGGRMIAGMRYLGEWQERLGQMVSELRKRAAILHLESLQELLSLGDEEGRLDLFRFLLPAIESGDISLILEASQKDVARADRSQGAFLQAFRPFVVEPLPARAAHSALSLVSARLGKLHSVRFSVDAIDCALDLGDRFMEGAPPGNAAPLLESAAKLSGGRGRVPRDTSVVASTVLDAFCRRSGYPRVLVDATMPLAPASVREQLHRRVLGQDEAIDLLANLVLTLKSNLGDPRKPLGSFLLLGPTGVGKTESALALTDYLFNDEKRLARFDMSEFAAPGSAFRLVDANARQSLAKRVREQPFGVVLLDEIEKADGSVLDLLLQVLGEGRLTDSAGRTVLFRNTVVILTSNLGAETVGRSLGFGEPDTTAEASHYRSAAAQHFRPELLNRFDHIVPYRPLTREIMRPLARRVLEQALAREGLTRRGITVRFAEPVVDRLMELGFDPRLGARPLKRAVEQHVVAPLAAKLSRESVTGEMVLEVGEDGEIGITQ